ncbi:hypothetical protein [Brevundimonas sp.]|uniref:hypothetical protein n=1 Tax=Brevundimonas sp. TaxID=1871086 RepID=UPI0035B322A8
MSLDFTTLQPERKNSCAYDDAEFIYYAANNTNSTFRRRKEPLADFRSRMAEHEAAPIKSGPNGPAVCLAEFAGGQRTKQAWKSTTGMVLDITTGVPVAEVKTALEKSRHLADLYTAYDHGRTETKVKKDDITKWWRGQGGGVVDQVAVARYLRDVKRWSEAILATVSYTGDRHTADGNMVLISHAAFPVTRIFLPLAAPFDPATAGETTGEAARLWGALIKRMGENLGLPVNIDKDALDPIRIVHLPRARDGFPREVHQINGDPLDLRALKVEAPAPLLTTAPTFDSIKGVIDALPPKAETPDPAPVLEMIARLDNHSHRETLLDALKRRAGGSISTYRKDVRDRRRAAGDGPEEGVKVDKETGYRTLVHANDVDHLEARAFILTTMDKANTAAAAPLFTLNMGQVMGLRRHDGRVSFEALSQRQFQSALFKHCSFAAHRDGGDLTHRIPDAEVCGVVLEGLEPGELPQQPMIRRAPSVSRDGRILDHDGWHGDVLVDLGDLTAPVVPPDPSPEEIAAARNLILEEVLGDFPFDDDAAGAKAQGDASRANAVGMLLTPFARDLFNGPSPVFAIVKPSPGVGGTLLAETVQRLFDGHASATTPNSRNEEEVQKHLVAAALGDDSFLFFDNVTDFNSETMKRTTTAEHIGGRILGLSKTVSRPNDFTWIITGINPRLGPEMARRSVFINLNSRVEDNAARNYRHDDFKGWLHDNRTRIIGALLTLIRAWWMAGAEPGKAKLASFESWSRVIGGVLETAGIDGFLSNPRKASADREGAEVKAFMSDWWKQWGEDDTAESTAFNYADGAGFVTGYGDDRRRRFGEMLDGLRGRTFDLNHKDADKLDRVMFGVGMEGWRLVHLGQVAKPEKVQ